MAWQASSYDGRSKQDRFSYRLCCIACKWGRVRVKLDGKRECMKYITSTGTLAKDKHPSANTTLAFELLTCLILCHILNRYFNWDIISRCACSIFIIPFTFYYITFFLVLHFDANLCPLHICNKHFIYSFILQSINENLE